MSTAATLKVLRFKGSPRRTRLEIAGFTPEQNATARYYLERLGELNDPIATEQVLQHLEMVARYFVAMDGRRYEV